MTKYTNIEIVPDVYCSSTCHYSIPVVYHLYGETKRLASFVRRDYLIGMGTLEGLGHIPAYVDAAIKTAIIAAHDAGTLKVYEHDRDGNKRYEDLRYHDPVAWGSMIEHWRNPSPATTYLSAESDEVRLLVMLIRTDQYRLLALKHPPAKRWDVHLIEAEPNADGNRGVYMNISHGKFEAAKRFLRLVNTGTNSRNEMYEEWGE